MKKKGNGNNFHRTEWAKPLNQKCSCKSRKWAVQLRRGGEAAGGVQVDERWAKSFGLMLWTRVIIRKSIMVEYSDEEVWLARVPLWNYTVHELAFWSTSFFRSSFRVARSHTTSIDLTESLLTSKYLMWAGGKDQEFPRLIFLKNLIVCILMKMPVGLQAESCPDTTNMESLYRAPFLVLECPNLKPRKQPWVHMPSAMMVYAVVVVSSFLIAGEIIYDVLVEPPGVGSMTGAWASDTSSFPCLQSKSTLYDGRTRVQLPAYMGGLGFIIPKLNRFLLVFIGFICVLLTFFMAGVLMRMKLLGWLSDGLECLLRRNPWILDLFLLAVPVLWYGIWKRMKRSI